MVVAEASTGIPVDVPEAMDLLVHSEQLPSDKTGVVLNKSLNVPARLKGVWLNSVWPSQVLPPWQ